MGIASMMMEEALEMIKETSLKILDLEVKEDNLSAINLYKKFNLKKLVDILKCFMSIKNIMMRF